MIDNESNAENTGAIVAGILIGGALVGGAIGLAIPVWRTYSFDNNQKYGLSIDYNIQANSIMIGAAGVLNF